MFYINEITELSGLLYYIIRYLWKSHIANNNNVIKGLNNNII